AQARADLEIRGLPALSARIEKVGDPVTVGGRVTYHVTVTNTGSLPGNDVTVQATLPPELRVVNANGPAQAQINDRQVVFRGVNGVQPKQSLRYTIETQALKAGDVRLEVKVNSDALSARGAVTKQGSTRTHAPLHADP